METIAVSSDCFEECVCEGDLMDCRNRGLMYVEDIYNARVRYIDYRGNRLTVDTIQKISEGLPSKSNLSNMDACY